MVRHDGGGVMDMTVGAPRRHAVAGSIGGRCRRWGDVRHHPRAAATTIHDGQ
ncbi:hypothetical protein [Sphingomonas sp. CFBP 8760]|uniref:hypothetical protein n=1 Tax=Sphingomonas sp. CFBP 8760 TaxID=2775282 RepID=UPI001A92E901|nr:hypothetical protein [Sphingomonas sp. CFBP 8760]